MNRILDDSDIAFHQRGEADSGAAFVTPVMSSAGNISLTFSNQWVQLPDQPASQVALVNDSGTKIEVRQGGAGPGLRILPDTAFTFFGIKNLNELWVRRVDQAATQVTITGRWDR